DLDERPFRDALEQALSAAAHLGVWADGGLAQGRPGRLAERLQAFARLLAVPELQAAELFDEVLDLAGLPRLRGGRRRKCNGAGGRKHDAQGDGGQGGERTPAAETSDVVHQTRPHRSTLRGLNCVNSSGDGKPRAAPNSATMRSRHAARFSMTLT